MTPERTAVAMSVANACTESAGTVQALADEVGVSYAALCSWSRGRRRPPAHRLLKLADVMEDRAERLRALAGVLRQHAGTAATSSQVGAQSSGNSAPTAMAASGRGVQAPGIVVMP